MTPISITITASRAMIIATAAIGAPRSQHQHENPNRNSLKVTRRIPERRVALRVPGKARQPTTSSENDHPSAGPAATAGRAEPTGCPVALGEPSFVRGGADGDPAPLADGPLAEGPLAGLETDRSPGSLGCRDAPAPRPVSLDPGDPGEGRPPSRGVGAALSAPRSDPAWSRPSDF